jgi:Predicted Rossmann fold nucleotide-binding protein
MIEISDPAELTARLDAGGTLVDVVLQDLTLDGVVDRLLDFELDRTYFFGCRAAANDLARLLAAGAAVFPKLNGLPFDPYRSDLYTPEELFAGFEPTDPCSYCVTPDAQIYDYWRTTGRAQADSIVHALARRLHDHAVSDALVDFLQVDDRARRAVAVMGGHDLLRAADGPYAEIARLSRRLTRDGFLMVSGGGPGAMEATHLGAWFADAPDDRLDDALAILAVAPRFDDFAFVAQAFAVVAANPGVVPRPSLGIPTWLYGHEPPTIFATCIAKYFDNSAREDGLVSVARRGIVFAPGGAGTVQELFQDAAQNSYFALGEASPMILLGREFWTETMPAIPLLDSINPGAPWHDIVTVVETSAEALTALHAHHALPSARAPWSFCTAHCGDRDQRP